VDAHIQEGAEGLEEHLKEVEAEIDRRKGQTS